MLDNDVATIRRLLAYDPVTGEIRWRENRPGGVKAGAIAGRQRPDGYRMIGVIGRHYLAHRLAWFISSGQWPENDLDHIDGNPSNNALANLRCATRAQNCANSRVRSANRSGFKGVRYLKPNKSWRAQITVNRRCVHLGLFATPEEAHAAYCAAARLAFGEFWRAA